MYLPHLKEEVDKIAENKKTLIVFCIVLIFVFAFGWLLCRYYDGRAGRENSHVTDTVQSVERDNQTARKNIGDAARQIEQARQQLDDAATAIDAGQRTVDDNKAVIDDSRQLIESSQRSLEQAESILSDIDRANQLYDQERSPTDKTT